MIGAINNGFISYAEYLLKFGRAEIAAELQEKVKTYIGPDDERRDAFIRDVLPIIKGLYENGTGYSKLESLLAGAFDYFELNTRVSFEEFKYFFEVYIKSRQSALTLSRDEAKEFYREFWAQAKVLSESLYKVNIYHALLNALMRGQFFNDFPGEIAEMVSYLDAQPQTHEEFQRKLSNVFRLEL